MGAAFANNGTKTHSNATFSATFKKHKVDFVRRFITMDETWVYHHDPESKQEAKEWCEPGCSTSKRVRVRKSAKKVMASVFLECESNFVWGLLANW